MPSPFKRPIGITLLALVHLWIGGLGTLFFPILFLTGFSGQISNALEESLIHSHALSIAIASLAVFVWFGGYVLYLCVGIGLWRLRRWALKTVVIIQWIIFACAAITCLIMLCFEPLLAIGVGVWSMGIVGVFLWYLTRPFVQWPFEATYALAHGQPVPAQPPPSTTALWMKIAIGAGIAAAVIGVFVASLLSFIQRSIRASDPYQIAMRQVQASPCVLAKLGSPIQQKGSISGSVNGGDNEGDAELEIPIRGPKAEASLYLKAEKLDGSWIFKDLTVDAPNDEIHLQPQASPCN